MTHTPIPLRVAASQESLSCQLMDELRLVCLKSDFSWLHVSTLVGVLEMLKLEMIERYK